MGTLPGGATDIVELPQATRKAQLTSARVNERIRNMTDPPAFRMNLEAFRRRELGFNTLIYARRRELVALGVRGGLVDGWFNRKRRPRTRELAGEPGPPLFLASQRFSRLRACGDSLPTNVCLQPGGRRCRYHRSGQEHEEQWRRWIFRRGAPHLSVHRICEERGRSEEHTSELQSPCNLVCRLLLEKKKNNNLQRYRELLHA